MAAVGIAVALIAARQMMAYAESHVQMVRVVVPARDIPAYSVITPADLTWREVVRGAEQEGTVKDPAEAVGAVALAPLYRGEQIRKERLGAAKDLSGRQVVAVNVDVTRSAGGMLAAGDLVDLWWVVEGSGPGLGGQPVAVDAVLVDLKDSAGRSLILRGAQGGLMGLAQGNEPAQAAPAVAVVAVKPEEVRNVVGGALPKAANVVLVKKFVRTGSTGTQAGGEASGGAQAGEAAAGAGGVQAGPEAGH